MNQCQGNLQNVLPNTDCHITGQSTGKLKKELELPTGH